MLTTPGILTIGNAAAGTVTKDTVTEYTTAALGTLNLDGIGAIVSAGSLNIGVASGGNGLLEIYNGSSINVTGSTYVAYGGANTGTIDFGLNGGTLTTASFSAGGFVGTTAFNDLLNAGQIIGVGTIDIMAAGGSILDTNVTINSTTNGTSLNSYYGSVGTVTVTTVLGNNFAGALGAGDVASAMLTITNGVTVTSQGGYMGSTTTGNGTVTVSGGASGTLAVVPAQLSA